VIQQLIEKVLAVDPTASLWLYNYYCEYCGRFLYDNEAKCKKCGTTVKHPARHPIPFVKSATATQKLIIWVRNMVEQRKIDESIIRLMIDSTVKFMNDPTITPEQYHYNIIKILVEGL
jgi:uncharacterized membrane protein YvbJ